MYKKLIEAIKSKDTFLNIFFSISVALLLSCILYKILLPVFGYTNLKDFYVGSTLYCNYNKYLIFPVFLFYILVFYITYFFNQIKFPQLNFNLEKYERCIYWGIGILFFILMSKYALNFSWPSVLDDHHYGEKFAAYYAHSQFNMKYYSDIMLVHGYLDILPSWIADNIFGNLTFLSERIASGLITYLFLFINLVLSVLIFRKNLLSVLVASNIFFFLLPAVDFTFITTVTLVYVFLIQYNDKLNSVLWFILYFTATIFFAMYKTTIGMSVLVASLPLLFIQIKEHKKSGCLILILAAGAAYVLLGEDIAAFLQKSQYYVTSNLYAFGTNFPGLINPYKFMIGTFAFLFMPAFLLQMLTTTDRKSQHTIIFVVLTTLFMFNYAFGRTEQRTFIPRALEWSIAVMTVVIPYIYYRMKSKNLFNANIVIISSLLIFSIWLMQPVFRLEGAGSKRGDYPKLTSMQKNQSKKAYTEYIRSVTTKDDLYLDLNNAGMMYYYTERKPAMPYTSFYNVVNTPQTEEILEHLKSNPPKIVFLYAPEIFMGFDDIRIPQRINKVYRWLFLSGLYEYRQYENGHFLIYNPDYTGEADFEEADVIGQPDLKYLPDVWGASLSTLPLESVVADIEIEDNTVHIKDGVKPENTDLVYVEYEAEGEVCIKMQVNAIPTQLELRSKKRKLLIPLDNYPSWLCADNISKITFTSDKPFKITYASLYKRK